ncbi:hypothetical protein HYFRA_00001364 [Hymenoscyphus fraxineus]|uniref:Mid2 domain-containing protein n=1 Tax=Hymenoscyphus fraxineus TaxID=746836 RepID=A0A9N9PTS5_9HELO|nr:hypothetical protein HYFRA_00001364 [Hymenoscyphus fraxineus]
MANRGGNHGVTFLYPPTGLSPNYLDTINVTYTSPFPDPLLYTWCRNASNPSDLVQKRLDRVTPYNGTLSVILDYLKVSSCYFNLRPNTTAGNGANSESIVLLPSARLPVPTVYGLQAGPTSTPQTNPETPQESNPESTPSPTPSPIPAAVNPANPPNGLATGAIAGIAIGASILGIALIASIIFLILRKRRQNSAALSKTVLPEEPYEKDHDHINEIYSPSPSYNPSLSAPPAAGQENRHPISEMSASQPGAIELNSQSVIHELGPGQSENGNNEKRR